jgi:FixJ family two-component response regulator
MTKTLRPVVAVVDDEDAIRKALERLLRSAGIAVEAYASGPEFLQSTHRHRGASSSTSA